MTVSLHTYKVNLGKEGNCYDIEMTDCGQIYTHLTYTTSFQSEITKRIININSHNHLTKSCRKTLNTPLIKHYPLKK